MFVAVPVTILLLASFWLWGSAPVQSRPAPARAPDTTPSAQRSRTEQPVPFKPGETLSYDVSWAGMLTAGTATVSVQRKRPSPGATVYEIVAEGKPTAWLSRLYDVSYRAESLMDVYTLLPQRSTVITDRGGRRRQVKVTHFDRAARTARYEVQTGDPPRVESRRDAKVPPETLDGLSLIYFLRSRPLAASSTYEMPVSVNGQTYRVRARVDGREEVRTGLGNVSALRITPTLTDEQGRPEGRDLAVWLSDDARRLPLKLQGALPVGNFILTLANANSQ
jgi:Protein of unknown function (DUF3108)